MKTKYKSWFMNYFLAPFSWSRWTDIDTFSYTAEAYLLQGRVNYRTNSKQFKVTSMKNTFSLAHIGKLDIAILEDRGLIDKNTKWN